MEPKGGIQEKDQNHHDKDAESSAEEDHAHNENLICRFYRKDFPDENDVVIVRMIIWKRSVNL
jgi:uncharacterized protein YbbC (DUF1343 family)